MYHVLQYVPGFLSCLALIVTEPGSTLAYSVPLVVGGSLTAFSSGTDGGLIRGAEEGGIWYLMGTPMCTHHTNHLLATPC